jgi:hypothetical protein
MANSYSARTGIQAKNHVSLGSSDALKRFEKIQARQSFDGTGTGKFTNKDSDSDESLFKNANKFMKQKKQPVRQETAKTSGDDSSDIELSILDAPKKSSINQVQHQQQQNRPTSRAMSALSIASSVSSTHRRSQSKVKFYESDQEKGDDQSIEDQTVEDMFSKNLVLDIQDLDSNETKRKSPMRKHARSPTKRSESIVSIIEEKEEYSALTPSIQSPSLLETKLILDIDELEKSVSKSEQETVSKQRRKKKDKYKEDHKTTERKKSDSKGKSVDRKESKQAKESKKEAKKKVQNKEVRKRSKQSRSRTSTILSNIGSESSISTEIISEVSSHRPNEITDTTNEDDDVRTQFSRGDSRSVTKYKNSTFYIQSKSYYEDFETDQDVTFRDSARHKKQLSFASDFKTYKSTEIQVDSNDLLKHSDLLRSVNAYNPSSLLLASVTHLHDQTTLRELNQITGYNLINQSFNDLIKMNLNFMRNFLNVQRTLYEQQIQSIQPK